MFIKAVSPDQNRHAARIHRREAEIASRLPTWVPAPRLLHVHDDGHWVALVFEDIAGRQPREPWTLDDLDLVMPAVAAFSQDATPSPIEELVTARDKHAAIFSGWRRFASGDGDLTRLPAWVSSHLHDLVAAEERWDAAAAGDTLLHADLRADNVLITPDGAVVLVDWPWACRGAAFVDPLFMLPSIGLGGGPDPAAVIDRYGLLDGVDEGSFVAVFAALCGFFSRASQDEAPPGLPDVRTFQRAQADIALAWLRTALA